MDKQETGGALPDAPQKKAVAQSARAFVSGMLSPLKDMSRLVEDFTAEMTLVAEGLSEDQQRLREQTDSLSAAQTLQEEATRRSLSAQADKIAAQEKEIALLKSRLDRVEKALNEKKAKGRRLDGLTGALRQATWLVGLLAGAWVVTTLIRALT